VNGRGWKRWLVLTAALGVLAFGAGLLAACGGDDDDDTADNGEATATTSSGDKLTYDPAKADQIAHSAILVETDLPGTGWKVIGTDAFSDGDEFGDDNASAACKAINETVREASDASEAVRAGRAQKEFEREGDLFESNVEVEVNIFENAKTPENSLKVFKDALESDDFETCFKDLIGEGASGIPGVKIEAKAVTPLSPTPNGGAARALEVQIKAVAVTAVVHLEYHIWRDGNAGITLSLNGPKADITAAAVRQVLEKTQTKLRAQATN
jgi:hypothetical protein